MTAQMVMPAIIGSGVPSKNAPATHRDRTRHQSAVLPSAPTRCRQSIMLLHGQHRRRQDDRAEEAVADKQHRRDDGQLPTPDTTTANSATIMVA